MPTQNLPPRPSLPTVESNTMVEPKPDASVGEIFLSPRVIDSATFNEFAQRLRSLVEQADASAQSLRDAMAEAATAKKSIDQSAAAQKERLQAAVKVLRAIDAVGAPAHAPTKFDGTELQASVEESRNKLGACADQLIARIRHHSQDAVLKADALTIKLNAAMSRCASSRDQLEESSQRAEKTSGQLASQGLSLSALHKRITDSLEELEDAAAQTIAQTQNQDICEPDGDTRVDSDTEQNEAAIAVADPLASLCTQALQLKDEIARSILEGSDQLDELKTRRRQLAGKVRDAILACQRAETSLLNTAQRVQTQSIDSSAMSESSGSPDS